MSETENVLLKYAPGLAGVLTKKHSRGVEICGPCPEVRLFLAVSAVMDYNKTILYVCETDDECKKLYDRAARFLDGEHVGYYPARDFIPCESVAANESLDVARIHVLECLHSEKPFLGIVSATTLKRRVIPVDIWDNTFLLFHVGDEIEISVLADLLTEMGYRREPITEEKGTFSVRGSVVDIFPTSEKNPLRLDFFDTEIDTIKNFDLSTQITIGSVDEITITPGASFFLKPCNREERTDKFFEEATAFGNSLKGDKKFSCLQKIQRYRDYLSESSFPDILEPLLPYFYEEAYIEDYLPENSIVFVDEPATLRKNSESEDVENVEILDELLYDGDIFPAYYRIFRNTEDLFGSLNKHKLIVFSFLQSPHGLDTDIYPNLSLRPFSFYLPLEQRKEEIAALAKKGPVYLCAGDEVSYKKFKGLSDSLEILSCRTIRMPLEISLESCESTAYFIAPEGLSAVAGIDSPRKSVRHHKKENAIESFVDLKKGDYVVHDTHGIGQFLGMERLNVQDVERDYLLIRYRGTDKLYVPVEQMNLLQKYIGNGDGEPRINSLGGKDWLKTKEKARLSVEKLAEELVRLYAERSQQPGFAFSADTTWQWDMESEFPFEETPDQLEAIADIKKDMEQTRPMDRLLCGDVGFGKTEVSIRAAFKAVMDHKQVAVLVPTTVLAQQHERTFKQRLEHFGVSIGVLSRFKSKKETDKVIADLAAGHVDIVIGTHMLLGKRIVYKDLGLLIIDEEQRFGVAHKEKIKQLKKNVDVLAMSATPIPRTLHMSLAGMRDISLIETPPEFRQPVKTYVLEYRQRLIKEAIEREISRGGQIYYLHNRVEDMGRISAELSLMVPDARIFVAHGQMDERQLESIMMDFMEKKADILLCTTIVESGLDIPNVNTLIVDDAERYGLSQMYQLRGRVGRSRRQAFAYFFYPAGKLLNTTAQKRLAAVRDYTDLGSGFKIAMRDMEIRGAGNILGGAQHGHMLSVGFDMYCRLIDEEVHRLKGIEPEKPQEEITIDVLCSSYIPDEYIGDSDLKIDLYKEISGARNLKELKASMNRMEDRFGSMPDAVYQLFLVMRLKLVAEYLDISAIQKMGKNFNVTFRSINGLSGKEISGLYQRYGKRFSFTMGNVLGVEINPGYKDPVKAVIALIKILGSVEEERKKQNAKEA